MPYIDNFIVHIGQIYRKQSISPQLRSLYSYLSHHLLDDKGFEDLHLEDEVLSGIA